ncbi:hypothetical protein LCS78_11285 [Vibrio harveyi]|uniref:hypothetical protein n=1 Tax=Vibrio harveyi TaxID=669 RepID=UPI00237EF81F|nr:hypothetical protein [Vibrio harveyi]HDM8068991.1 hypothetical protein [Vibrio harveyi]
MSYEFGNDGIGIKNPFRTEGVFKIIRGVITLAVGAFILLNAPEMSKINQYMVWTTLTIAFLVLSIGLVALSKGFMQVVRFYVGRNAPTSLAYDYADLSREREDCLYTSETLEQMLMNRTNTTFNEPKSVIELILHSIFPKLIFAAIPVRNIVQNVIFAVIQSCVALISLSLTYFVLSTNILPIESSFALKLYSLFIVIYLLKVWFVAGRNINKKSVANISKISTFDLVKTVVFSVSLPILLSVILNNIPDNLIQTVNLIFSLNESDVSYYDNLEALLAGIVSEINFVPMLFAMISISLLVVIYTLLMFAFNSNVDYPKTETSESRETWEQNIHPKEIFINLDQVVMANRKYKNIPNRSYIKFNPLLNEQSGGKGSYRGKFLQETQPVVVEKTLSASHKLTRLFGTVSSQLTLLLSTVFIYLAYTNLSDVANGFLNLNSLSNRSAFELGVLVIEQCDYILITLILFTFGRLLSNHSHIYWAEVKFKSKLLFLNCEGTYTESRLTIGKGVYDSAQSENIIVKTANTSICIATEIITTTFAGVGSQNLEMPRYIIDMQAASVDMNSILSELKENLNSRTKITTFDNHSDLEAVNTFNQINSLQNKPSQSASAEHSLQDNAHLLNASN